MRRLRNSWPPENPLVRRLQARFSFASGRRSPGLGSGPCPDGAIWQRDRAFGAWFRVPRRRRRTGRRSRAARVPDRPDLALQPSGGAAALPLRAFRAAHQQPMRWTSRVAMERATVRAKAPAPCARTRSRPRCSRLLIAESTAGCCRRIAANHSSPSRSRSALLRCRGTSTA